MALPIDQVAGHLAGAFADLGAVSGFFAARGLAPDVARTTAFVLVHAIDGAANAVANRPDQVGPRPAAHMLAAMVLAYLERLGLHSPGSR